jgi:hypothetical protein
VCQLASTPGPEAVLACTGDTAPLGTGICKNVILAIGPKVGSVMSIKQCDRYVRFRASRAACCREGLIHYQCPNRARSGVASSAAWRPRFRLRLCCCRQLATRRHRQRRRRRRRRRRHSAHQVENMVARSISDFPTFAPPLARRASLLPSQQDVRCMRRYSIIRGCCATILLAVDNAQPLRRGHRW